MDLFDNPVGCLPSLEKCFAFCCFLAVVVYKKKFLNNSNKFLAFLAVLILAAQGASANIVFSFDGKKIALIADLPNYDY
jgi:hypothetical protein